MSKITKMKKSTRKALEKLVNNSVNDNWRVNFSVKFIQIIDKADWKKRKKLK